MDRDLQRRIRAVQSRDARFDGDFFIAVVTTGIYCRPSCPATLPKPRNMRFYPTAAAAQQAGFRACKRCRPDTTPESPQWDIRADMAGRAMRLIADGVVDREGVAGLSQRLGYSVRQVERQLRAELGAGPLALARAQRAQTARLLIEATGLPLGEVAFAAGFSSIRTFNDTIGAVYDSTPSQLRHRRGNRGGQPPKPGQLCVRLPFRQPMRPDNLFGHLAATAVPGVEEWRDGAYRRTLRLPHGHGIVELRFATDHIDCRLWLGDLRDLQLSICLCRRLLDLNADPHAIAEQLRGDRALAPLVDQAVGRRVPGTVDAAEFAVRAVLGQQVSTAAARTHAGRLVAAHGQEISDPHGGLTHVFPSSAALREMDPSRLRMPRSRQRTLSAMVAHLDDGRLRLDSGACRIDAREALRHIPGIGPWTTESILMRGMGDPDAFSSADLGIKRAAVALGLPVAPAALAARAEAWRPWRSYATQYLWTATDHAINRFPE